MNNFKIAEPQTLQQAASFYADSGASTHVIAGGTDLLGEIKAGICAPDVVIDLASIPNLSYIRKEKDGVAIGAMTTLSELAEHSLIKQEYRALHEAAGAAASPQLRNVGTVGGNLCQRPRCWYYRDPQVNCRKKGGTRCFAFRGKNKYHAILGGGVCYIVHPSDLAPALIALEAKAVISSAKGEKTIPASEFFVLPSVNIRRENILNPGEILKEVRIPQHKDVEKSTYLKFKERGAWDFAVVSTAIRAAAAGGVLTDISIVLGGVAPVPWRLSKAENALKGKSPSEETVRQAAREALAEAKPLEENGYKKDLVEVILARAVMSLV